VLLLIESSVTMTAAGFNTSFIAQLRKTIDLIMFVAKIHA